MRIRPAGKLAIFIVVLGIAFGGYRLWQQRGGGFNIGGIGKGSVTKGHTISGDQGILGRPLRVGVNTWPGFGGGFAANGGHFKPNRDSIFWKNHNLLVEFILMDDVDPRAKAFARGDVDLVWSTVDFFANEAPGFRKGGVNPKAVIQVDWSRGGDAIVVDDSIHSVEDLKGKKIALTLFTPSHWLLASSLQNSSLDESDQDRIMKGLVGKNVSSDAEKDFVSNKVDAAVLWEPDVTNALKDRPGCHILVSTKTAANLISDILIARSEFLNQHPDAVKAFVRGWMDGTEEANRHPETVVSCLLENEPTYTDLGEDKTRETLSTVHFAGLADNAKTFGLDGSDPLFDRIFTQVGATWVRNGIITSAVAPGDVKDDRFVRAAYQAIPKKERTVTPREEFRFKPATASKRTQRAIMTRPVKIHFESNSSALTEDAKNVLDNVATLIQTYSNAYIRVEGNSASTGHAAGEVRLSQMRAESVVRYMVKRYGFDRNRFIAVGNGPYKPVASNNTEAGQAKNRRTDIKVVSK
ncbi:MAG TPA: phosphate ABC transporter substrate-binding/OmpA family protein [Armatimonadota bacterium]|jgi:outer membrane protein OmpA-like peptidoglycan-associated protein/ABC-type amino acid transport substrate-binding protein